MFHVTTLNVLCGHKAQRSLAWQNQESRVGDVGTRDLMGLQVMQHHHVTLSGWAHLGVSLIRDGFPQLEGVGFCYCQSHSYGCI